MSTSNDQLYHVGIGAALECGGTGANESAANVILHVYVKAPDVTYASAAASDLCRDLGMTLRSFTYLASEEQVATLLPGEEHATAFRHANVHGIAYVLSSIFDGCHRRIGMPHLS